MKLSKLAENTGTAGVVHQERRESRGSMNLPERDPPVVSELRADWRLGDSCLHPIRNGGTMSPSGIRECPPSKEVSSPDSLDRSDETSEESVITTGADGLMASAKAAAKEGNVILERHLAREVKQPGDGSCLFHSLAYGLNDGTSARRLRREISLFIKNNPNMEIAGMTLQDWVKLDCGRSIRRYAEKMAAGAEGGGIELEVFTRLKGMSVHVYERCSLGYRRIGCFDAGPDSKGEVSILYRKRMHYDSLVIAASCASV
jgi:hypothetical protein